MKSTSGKRGIKIALAVGLVAFAAVWFFFFQSPHYRLASGLVSGPELRSLAGDVKFSYPSGFRLTGSRSSITYYVVGTQRSGFLNVVLEDSGGRLRINAAAFDQVPLALVDARERSVSP